MRKLMRYVPLMILCLLLTLLSPWEAEAASSSDLTFMLNSDGESYSVTDCSSSASGAMIIPANYNGKPVTQIGASAFYGCYLSSVEIPDSIATIGDKAFYFTNLSSVTIPSSVTSIGDRAFANCSQLTQIRVDNNNPVYSSDGKVLFNKDKTILIQAPSRLYGSYTVPNTVTEIAAYAFDMCGYGSMSRVTIPNSVKSIGAYAFSGCFALTSVTIPDSITHLGSGVFQNCQKLTNVSIPDSVVSVDNSAFDACTKLAYNTYDNATYLGNSANPHVVLMKATSTSVTQCEIHPNTKVIAGSAFSGCTSLTSISLPSGLAGIGSYAFYNCDALTDVTIPNGVTAVGDFAFYDCLRLSRVTMADTVTSIGSWAFYNCGSLTTINMPAGITSISDRMFYKCSKLTSIIIPDGVNQIGRGVFDNCSKLTSIKIPASVKKIGSGAFYGCYNLSVVSISDLDAWCRIQFESKDANPCNAYSGNLWLNGAQVTEVTIPADMTYIGDYVFAGCNSLQAVTIPDAVTSIGKEAFYDCNNLKTITLTDSVADIGQSAFYGCSKLVDIYYDGTEAQWEAVTIGSNNTPLTKATLHCKPAYPFTYEIINGEVTITDCDESTAGELVIPDMIDGYPVTEIGVDAFADCSKLTSVVIPDSVTWIGYGVFERCRNLTSVTFSSNFTRIPDWMFDGCESLTEIAIPNGVTEIGYGAFTSCVRLSSITIPASLDYIGPGAFNGCIGLTDVYISDVSAWCKIDFNHELNDSSMPKYNTPMYYARKLHILDAEGNEVTEVVLDSTVTTIPALAFKGCSEITCITIPDSVTAVGEGAFNTCAALQDVYYGGTKAQWDQISIDDTKNESLRSAALHCKDMELLNDGTIRVLEHTQVEELTVTVDQILDLNGHILTVNSLASFGQIIDSVGGGGLVVNNIEITSNAWLPIKDSTGCYRFYEYAVDSLGTKESTESVTFGFALDFKDTMAYTTLLQSEDMQITVSLAWGENSKTFAFSKELIQKYVGLVAKYPALRPYLRLNVTSIDSLADDTVLTVTPAVAAIGGKIQNIGEGMQYIA